MAYSNHNERVVGTVIWPIMKIKKKFHICEKWKSTVMELSQKFTS